MALDGIILSKIKEDLDARLPIRINRISDTSATEIVFNIHSEGVRCNMVMSFHSVYNHICLSDKNFATHNDPSTFVMVLRKYIANGVIYEIEQNEYDRYLLMHIKALDDLYDERHFILSVELMGKYANLILVDANTNRIIDALKKIPPYENTRRTILQGAEFTLPDKQNKIDFFSGETFNIEESLVKQLQGFSKTLEKEVRYRLESETLDDIRKEIKESKSLYLSRNEDGFEYHVIPLTHLEAIPEQYELNKGFDELYFELDEKERIRNVTEDIFKFVKKELRHFELKVEKLNASLNDALNLEDDRENGDLLFTYGDLNVKGLKEVNIYDKIIKLDPRYSIKDNARKYYQRYQKKRKGQNYINEQLEIAGREVEYFSALIEQLTIANFDDANTIKEELVKYGYLRTKLKKKPGNKKKINLYQVKVDGYTITFGKNNIQNNAVTFDYARNSYTWFHAKGFHGAHVVVDDDEPNEKIIRICANLAAWYSQGRYSSSVPVDYCPVKNIKKIPGAKMGFVSYTHNKTIYIDPYQDREIEIDNI